MQLTAASGQGQSDATNGSLEGRVAFVTYEGPWFPAGGIAAVMGRLPAAVADAVGSTTIVVTPFHRRSDALKKLPRAFVDTIVVPDGEEQRSVKVSRYPVSSACVWYFLEPEDESSNPTFDGRRHPYDVPADRLLKDSLFLGSATVRLLAHLDAKARWTLLLQDWEAATVALAVAGGAPWLDARCHLTLHNTYDAGVDAARLRDAHIDPEACPGDTVLSRALRLVQRPVLTVSEQFAADIKTDLLQRSIMVPHLQSALRDGEIVGIHNGPFKELALDALNLSAAARGDYNGLAEWKLNRRASALAALQAHVSTPDRPLWGDKAKFRADAVCWFVMAGRDDPRQKGYDVGVAAVEAYLVAHHGQEECAQFLFFPNPGDEGKEGLRFLEELAGRFPEDVVAFPFVWKEGFEAALQGSSYGLMPSLYEPFGMANEFYLYGGCVGIARATGGNIEQIVPLRASATFSSAVRLRANRFFDVSARPTGLLFREPDGGDSDRADWDAINRADYAVNGEGLSRLHQRRSLSLFRRLTREMKIAIEEGLRIRLEDPDLYFRMVVDGIAHVHTSFSWKRAAAEYSRQIQ